MRRLIATVVLAVVTALAVAPVRRKLIEFFTRVNGTWVGIPKMPAGKRAS